MPGSPGESLPLGEIPSGPPRETTCAFGHFSSRQVSAERFFREASAWGGFLGPVCAVAPTPSWALLPGNLCVTPSRPHDHAALSSPPGCPPPGPVSEGSLDG